MRRHDLAWLRPEGWETILGGCPSDALVREWAARDWPLVRRRPLPGEAQGVPLGLPTPPADGKRRLSFLVPPDAIARVVPPLTLMEALPGLPISWRPTAEALASIGERHGARIHVFGSAAFQALTGLGYLTQASDLDLLLVVGSNARLEALAADLRRLAEETPMRLDGEVMGPEGAACKWREFGSVPGDILIRTADAIFFGTPGRILSAGTQP